MPTCLLCVGRAQQRNSGAWQMPFCPHMKLDNSAPPHMSLVPFDLLPQCWSSALVSPSVSKCRCGPFKRNAWDFSSPVSLSATIPTDFQSQKLWGLLFPLLDSWAGNFDMGLGPLSPHGILYTEIFLLILNHHVWEWDQPISASTPLLPVLMWLLF